MLYVKPTQGFITSLFSNSRPNPVLHGVIRPHQGCDISGAADNTVIAAASGVVRFAESNPKRTGFGYYVVITHSNGQESLYAHLASISVKAGQNVKQGARIGVKGSTGNSTGTHLHFEISRGRWTNVFANKIDPLTQFIDPMTRTMQAHLNRLGYGPLAEDGLYGDAMISAVTRFQRDSRFKVVDGVAGRETYDALERTKSKAPASAAKGADVLELNQRQKDDMARIFKKAREAGIFSSATHEADVKAGKMTLSQAVYLTALLTESTIK